jgi:transposase, IS30 family
VDKEVGYRWLRESYLRRRRDGKAPAEAEALLSFVSTRLLPGKQW